MFCITYPGGAYGNFVSWTLEWMQGNFPVENRPFTDQRNSHNWSSNYSLTVDQACSDVKNNTILETREHLSYYLWDQHIAEVRFNDVDSYSNPRFKKIEINMIRDQFVDTFMELADWLEIEVMRSIADIKVLHTDWLKNEPYLYKDKLIKDLTSAIINVSHKSLS